VPFERDRLSHSVRDELAERISSGALQPGARLPPEPHLASDLGVSRPTLREALRSLEEEGFLRRMRGSGTFVTHRPRLRNNLDVNFGVTDAIRAAGLVPGTEDLRIVEALASADEARRLAIERGGLLVVVERVRTADRRPVVYSRDVIPTAFLGAARGAVDRLEDGSLYDLLQRELGVVIHHGVASIEPAKANRAVAGRLRVIRGALLLHLRQSDYDESGRPALYSQDYYLADAFNFTVARRGPGRRSGPRTARRWPAQVG
jgi:GntR family transcriptional regulator